MVYCHIPKEQRNGKFDERARPCMFLGYVHKTTKIYRIWDFAGRGRALESSNIRFVEDENAWFAKPGLGTGDEHPAYFPAWHPKWMMLYMRAMRVRSWIIMIAPICRRGIQVDRQRACTCLRAILMVRTTPTRGHHEMVFTSTQLSRGREDLGLWAWGLRERRVASGWLPNPAPPPSPRIPIGSQDADWRWLRLHVQASLQHGT